MNETDRSASRILVLQPQPAGAQALNPQRASPVRTAPGTESIQVTWARHQDEVGEAQRLRFDVFSDEMGARLETRVPGHDIDIFDDFCEHLLVRDATTSKVLGTYRVLTPAQARRIGSTYSDTEFDLTRLRSLRGSMVEIGRSCVHRDHRQGKVIMALWGALAAFMVDNQLDTMIGCASIPMQHNAATGLIGGGHAAASIWNQFRQGSRFAAATVRRAPYRAVFISDLHLGTPGCQAEALLEFLKEHPSEYLYLVGDIVDGWQLRRKWYWPQTHNDVVQKIMRKARKGCRVVFIPGNHDMFARQFDGQHFGGIAVQQEAVHVTATGQRLWVTHGDAFDAVVQCARWLAVVGDNLYGITLRLNRHLNRLRGHFGLPYWSLSAYLKHKVKKALNYVTDFENAVAREARKRGHDGVVCGHIHRAEMRHIDGTLYCNDGDWVESRTALLEHPDGRLELRHWQAAPTRQSDAVPASAVV